jgi:hypothetical protein
VVDGAGAHRATQDVAIAPSVLRKPYGHFGGVITLAVRSPRDRKDDAGLASVLRAAVDDWSAHLVDFAAEVGLGLFDRWEGRVKALVLPETLDGPVVVAAGREDAWRYDNAHVIPWRVLRTIATAVKRHLESEGWEGAKVVKPKMFPLPGRVYQAPNSVVLRAVERRSIDWEDAVAVKGRLVDAALRWGEQVEGPTYLSLGQFPVSFWSRVPDELAQILVDLDVHVDCASGSAKEAVAYARIGWRAFDLGWGGRAVDDGARLVQGERLAGALAAHGAALSYGCISFDDKLWPIDDPAGAVRSWRSHTHHYRDAASALVLDAFWTQLLTDDHLARAPAVADAEEATGGRHLLQIGPPADWLEPPGRDAQRNIGRTILAGCLADKASMRELKRDVRAEWKASQPLPQDASPP